MKKNVYAVIDTASGVYDGPIAGQSDGVMIRGFSDMATDADHPIGKHPEHFALIKVGSWNDGTGELEDYQNHTLITGLEAVAQSRKLDRERMAELDASISPGGTK